HRDDAAAALRRLGLSVEVGQGGADGDELVVAPASFRPDLTREVDLIEEVLRLRGYDQLPATLPPMAEPPSGEGDRRPAVIRTALTSLGWNEAITFGFTSPSKIRALRLAEGDPRLEMVALRNPMSVEQSVMRTTLVSNLLAAAARNLKYGIDDVWLFEIGSVFVPHPGRALPDEPQRVAGVVCGRRSGWLADAAEADFYDAKAAVERVIAELAAGDATGVWSRPPRFEPLRDAPYLHPGVAASVLSSDGERLGEVGQVHPAVAADFELHRPCFVFDLDLARLPRPAPRQMRAVPRFPAITRDVSLFVAADLPAGRVGDLIAERREDLIEQVRVLEEYRDPARVPAGQKGLLWSITYRSSERTLTDGEVDERHEALVSHLVERLAATRR
ncbi:MAG TPA: phenylalanine--tRNA ligase subunit beta, partial [Planctomycetota bacterium]|nr:phenylalanine--tRNA ligase subunit beta [Planctomycetota bacterium]